MKIIQPELEIAICLWMFSFVGQQQQSGDEAPRWSRKELSVLDEFFIKTKGKLGDPDVEMLANTFGKTKRQVNCLLSVSMLTLQSNPNLEVSLLPLCGICKRSKTLPCYSVYKNTFGLY